MKICDLDNSILNHLEWVNAMGLRLKSLIASCLMLAYARSARMLLIVSLITASIGVGCGGGPESDAFGNFEATEITVSAQVEGRLLQFAATEGVTLDAGESLGLIDTTQLAAHRDNLLEQRLNLRAQKASVRAQNRAAIAQILEAEAQVEVWQVQLNTAKEEYERTLKLASVQAATQRETNERAGRVDHLNALKKQASAKVKAVQAQAEVYVAQDAAIDAQIGALNAQLRQAEARLQDAFIINPISGTILTVFSNAGELVRPGSPLYSIAKVDPITLRAYVTGNQLTNIKTGMTVQVLFDDGNEGIESKEGVLSYVSSEAEFTPTPIQTRDERTELVYAVEVKTPNPDGRLKIGMPGEIQLPVTAGE